MNIYLLIILSALVGEHCLRSIAKQLDLMALVPGLPAEFAGYYSEEEYGRSQSYTRITTRFSQVRSTFDIVLILVFILMGGFNIADEIVRGFQLPTIASGLVFFGLLFLAKDLVSMPFAIYKAFVIEEKFGFNKITVKIFVADKLKGYLVISILGSAMLGAVLYFFQELGPGAWLYAWGITALFILLAPTLFNTVIAPLFNKFTPLEDGELKQGIETYATTVDFPLDRVDVMDGSKRSTKSNAYFSGLGKKKRIALFDTLIEQQSIDEMVAVLAHEVGHFKKKHVLKGVVVSIVHLGVVFFLLSCFIGNRGLFDAFKMEAISVYAGMTFFLILYSPVELALSVVMNAISRKNEYEADSFSAETTGSVENLITGLKKLSVSNLGNLTPHRFSVFLDHSHPPVLARIKALRKMALE